MSPLRHELSMPDLGLDDRPITVSLWLVDVGDEVVCGDRLVELSADGVTVDLPAPASGLLVETLVGEDEPLTVGQVLAVIESEEEEVADPARG
ncbi:MAG: biotin/lipoyl-containing protein [Pirellulales bacterium]